MLSFGPSFEYAFAAPVAGCVGISAAGFASNSICSTEGAGSQVIKAESYGVWSLGLDVKMTL